MRICYYDLLNVDRTATPEEIKKSYRKQALIWHPDKNADRVQEATERFAMIQEAYEVLSDPHERAWYDGHRDAILRGDDHAGQKDSSAGMTAEDLMRYFSVSEFHGYDDSDRGFYTVYRKLFDKLNEEEEMAYRNDPAEDGASFTRYPSFGNSKTPFADNDGFLGYGSYVRDFYTAWTNFSSVKSFRWMDKWRLSEAPNRYVRRAMEKENKKARENARREYNDTVRSLARFVRKRDPRYKAFQAEEEKRKEAAAAEQRARIQREREALQAQAAAYQEQEWAKIDNDGLEDLLSSENEEEEQVESSEFYCVVCDKYYKSERQFASHEISRKHVRLAQAMKEEMMADEEAFDFTGSSTTPQEEKQPEDASDVGESNVQTAGKSKKKKNKNKQKMMPRWGLEEEDQEIDDVAALTAALELEQARRRRNKGGNAETIIDEQNTKEPTTTTTATVEDKGDLSEQDNKPETPAKTKKQKRKEKRKEADNAGHRCNVCGSDFSSRNQLFNHIKETGHALAVPLKQGKSKKR